MTERIEALERLQRLRDSGALTDAEFEREKAALLAPRQPPPLAPQPLPSRGIPLWAWIVGAAALLLVAIAAAMLFLRGDGESERAIGTNVTVPGPAQPSANETQPVPQPTVRSRPPAEQLALAFEAAFGRRGSAVRVLEDSEITYRPRALYWIGGRAVLVSAGTNSQDCHACAGALAIHFLAPSGDGFGVRGEWLDGGGRADWGHPPDSRLSTEISHQPMLRTEYGGGGQGVFCSFVTFTTLSGNEPREAARIPIGFSDSSGITETDGTDIEGRIASVRPDVSFVVSYSGTRSFEERWVKRGERFVPERGESQLPTC